MNTLDLVCLVADKNMEATVQGLLSRPRSLGICEICFRTLVHPRHDPGCFHDPEEVLRPFHRYAHHALVLLDGAWAGAPGNAFQLQSELESRLNNAFDPKWAGAVVIDPELEAWVFSRSTHVERVFGWHGRQPSLRQALQQAGYWPSNARKPNRPKEAVEYALKVSRTPRSSSLYRELARNVSLQGCQDAAFQRFRSALQHWFGAGGTSPGGT